MAPGALDRVAGRGSSVQWHAAPSAARIEPRHLDALIVANSDQVIDAELRRIVQDFAARDLDAAVITFATIACAVGPVNGGSPVSISYSTHPSAYTSVAVVTPSVPGRTCSAGSAATGAARSICSTAPPTSRTGSTSPTTRRRTARAGGRAI